MGSVYMGIKRMYFNAIYSGTLNFSRHNPQEDFLWDFQYTKTLSKFGKYDKQEVILENISANGVYQIVDKDTPYDFRSEQFYVKGSWVDGLVMLYPEAKVTIEEEEE